MKKIIFSGFMGAILAGPALADGSSVTTKNYVDDGLRAVYSASKGYTDTKVGTLPTDVANLKTTVNGDGTAANPGLNKIINGDGTNLGLNEIVKGNGTTTTGLVGDINALNTQINGTNGLAATVAGLQAASTTYNPGDGIAIDTTNGNNTISVDTGAGVTFDANNKLTIDGLATTQASGNTTTMYVYKNGALVPMDVETTWDTNFDFEGNNNDNDNDGE